MESAKTPRFYFDLRRECQAQRAGEAAFTPPISLVVACKAALDFVASLGGVDALVRNAAALAEMTRVAAAAVGLPLVAPRHHGDALTALFPPQGLEAGAIVKTLKEEFASTVAGGQGQLKGKIFRVAHLGYFGPFDILTSVTATEMALSDLGVPITRGTGTAAAEAILEAGPAKR